MELRDAYAVVLIFVLSALLIPFPPYTSAYDSASSLTDLQANLSSEDFVEPIIYHPDVLVVLSVAVHEVEAEPEKEFVPNEIIVGFESIINQILLDVEEAGGDILELIPSLNAVRVSVASSMENAFITAMKSKPGVRYVERNYIFKAVHTPNDPYWSNQWGMRIIQADSAWDIHKGSTFVTVAIVDTGIEYTHDDLSQHYVTLGYDWVNNDNDPMDDDGHGTHCAGIAAAVMDNGIGVVGVAQVSLMAEKVLGADGTGTADDVAQGIVHAADAGAEVISISLGSYFSSSLIGDACQYAWNKGSILIAAAGNDNMPRKHYPAAYDTVIAVAATDRSDGKASYSNWGGWIELSAPGGDGADYHDWIFSTYLDNWYTWAYGTSMATPHVSGLAALVWSYESSLNNTELREHLRSTADDLGDAGKDKYYGYGRINAYRALDELVGDVAMISVTPSATEAYPIWEVPLEINITVKNEGYHNETFTVTAYYNESATFYQIGNQTITNLAPGTNTTVTFSWSLAGVGYCNHTVKANATLIGVVDTNPANNEGYSWVRVKMPGDVDGDRKVSYLDAFTLADAYNSKPGDPNWDPNCDFDADNKVGYLDLLTLADYYNQEY